MGERVRVRTVAAVSVLVAAVGLVGLAGPWSGPTGAQEPAATPAAAFDAARTADLQTRVADLTTRVADLGGADPAAVAGRLGGSREGFDAAYGVPVAYLGPGQVQYEVADIGRVAVTFDAGRAERIAVVAPRVADRPLTEPDPADWSPERARQIADLFAPADAPLPADAVLGAEATSVTSETLGAATAVADAAGCLAAGPRAYVVTAAAPAPDRVAAVELVLGPPAAAPAASGGRSNRGAGAVANSSLGGVVSVNGVSIQALQARSEAPAPRPAGDGASWFAVELALENGARRAVTFAPADFLLVGADGSEIVAACGGVEPAFPLTEIERGDAAEGWVSFQVPADFVPEQLVVLAPNARVGFDLG